MLKHHKRMVHVHVLQVFCTHDPTLIPPYFSSVPFRPDRCLVNLSRSLNLFGREIIFEVLQSILSRYVNVTDRPTDTQTIYCLITALCIASCGKNAKHYEKYINISQNTATSPDPTPIGRPTPVLSIPCSFLLTCALMRQKLNMHARNKTLLVQFLVL